MKILVPLYFVLILLVALGLSLRIVPSASTVYAGSSQSTATLEKNNNGVP